MRPPSPAQQGMVLIEVLMASAVLGVGLLGATQLTRQAQLVATESRQNMVAQHLAQEAIECLHAHAPHHASACPAQQTIVVQGVPYTRQLQTSAPGAGQPTELLVRVAWTPAHKGSGSTRPNGLNAGTQEPARQEMTWRSRISAVPAWVGVSSP